MPVLFFSAGEKAIPPPQSQTRQTFLFFQTPLPAPGDALSPEPPRVDAPCPPGGERGQNSRRGAAKHPVRAGGRKGEKRELARAGPRTRPRRGRCAEEDCAWERTPTRVGGGCLPTGAQFAPTSTGPLKRLLCAEAQPGVPMYERPTRACGSEWSVSQVPPSGGGRGSARALLSGREGGHWARYL